MPPRYAQIALTLALVVALAGCKRNNDAADGEGAAKVTPTSTDDARAPLVDEDYRFRLDWPGPGWKVLQEDDVKKLVPDASAGLIGHGRLYAAVIIERAPELELDTFEAMLDAGLPIEARVTESNEDIDFAGSRARKTLFRGSIGGVELRYGRLVFLHQGYGYQIMAWGQPSQTTAADLQPVFDAFHLLPGEVKARAERGKSVDTEGPGWRVRDQVFESAVSGLRLRPPEGWRLVVGGELAAMNPDAEVGIMASDPELYILVMQEPIVGDPERWIATRRADVAAGGEPIEPERPLIVKSGVAASGELPVARYTDPGPPVLRYVNAATAHGDRGFVVSAWSHAALAEAAEPRITAALASFTVMTPAERDALERALATGAVDRQNTVEGTRSLRRGVFHDFASGAHWQRPATGIWRLLAGADARLYDPDLALYIEEPRAGVVGYLYVSDEAGVDAAAFHEVALAGLDVTATASGEVAGLPGGRFTHGTAVAGDDTTLDYRVVTAVTPSAAVQLRISGRAGAAARHPALFDALAQGLSLDPTAPATADDGPRYRDERLGFAVTLPADDDGGWTRRDVTPPEFVPVGSVQEWRRGRDHVTALALCVLSEGQDESWFMGLLEQLVGDGLRGRAGASVRSEVTLAGVPGRRLRWPDADRVEVDLTVRDRTFYALFFQTSDRALVASVLADFQLLDGPAPRVRPERRRGAGDGEVRAEE